jgi:hypothetical protein
MARPLRIQYHGAFYHVTSRGNERKQIYSDEGDRPWKEQKCKSTGRIRGFEGSRIQVQKTKRVEAGSLESGRAKVISSIIVRGFFALANSTSRKGFEGST